MLFELAEYEADKANSTSDEEALANACKKEFMSQKYWTAGLWIVTCCCPRKVIYGVKKMVTGTSLTSAPTTAPVTTITPTSAPTPSYSSSGESPRFILDFLMTRAPPGWDPTIFYDAACKVK